MAAFPFDIHATDGAARTGVLKTPRGDIRTPAFMPVGTAGTVKALTVDQVKQAGADIILGNTYHLMLRPGAERVKRLGGLHRFMRWDGPILTDSGGFQVMSLSAISKVKEDAVTFQSHIDGSKHVLSPERSIEIQADLLGSDIVMQLDECVSWPAEEDRAAGALRLSARWGARCKAAFGARDTQALFGIQQGSTFEHLRRESAERVARLGGLHRFMRWDGPILTDSGGFQVMSLAKIAKVSEEAVTFQSHLDGSRHALSPERSIEIQADLLGSDIVMQLDE
ncbi:MAG TPA: tRNA-guanine transglycosylase, partial [Planctomycetota bacterium]|nr:tRNA-guanine transglycosylase [Planctomycetota bacterium]